jgi:inorganic pyrophosphatase
MTDLRKIAHALDRKARTCRAIVETPQGSRAKYDYDPATGLFQLAGVLPAGMAFPLSFGFVPGTQGEDGDAIDVLILSDEALPIGILVEVRLLGIIEAEQTEGKATFRNDRLVAKVSQSRGWADVDSLSQLGDAFAKDLTSFFQTYNGLKGKTFKVTGLGSPASACSAVEKSDVGHGEPKP